MKLFAYVLTISNIACRVTYLLILYIHVHTCIRTQRNHTFIARAENVDGRKERSPYGVFLRALGHLK